MNSGEGCFYMHVPASKTGLVIGKGGDTIRQISSESGAHVELSRGTFIVEYRKSSNPLLQPPVL